MKFLNYLYGGHHFVLRKISNDDPNFTAKLLVAATVLIHLFLIFVIFEKAGGPSFASFFPNKYYSVLLSAPLLILILLYYSRQRVEGIMKSFNEKTAKKKSMAGFIATALFIVPILAIAILSKK